MTTLRPLITEKTLKLSESGWFSFIVPLHTTKDDIYSAVDRFYKLTPLKVNSTSKKSLSRKRGKHSFSTKGYKVVRIHLPNDKKIPDFEISTK